MLTILFFVSEKANAVTTTGILAIASLAQAFSNVVIDAVLIIQSRKDPEFGSQDLVSVMFLTQSLAGVIACTVAAIAMEKFHPKYAFLGYGLFGLFVFISCIFLSSDAEKDFLKGDEPMLSEWSSVIEQGQTPS